jgi:hypothetical protein
MGTRQAVIRASILFVFNAFSEVEAGRAEPQPRLAEPSGRPTGLRADRLSGKNLEKWNKIVSVVMAEDRDGRPLHPALRRLWDAVDGSGHTVFIEIPDTRSYFAGRFEVTTVDPDGTAHEAIILLNLRAIDRASTGAAAARADGFIPFKGLKKAERHAEVLGHELAHAAWHLASPGRARLAQQLQGRLEQQAQALMASGAAGAGAQESDLDRLARELEEPAETAERAIWEELRAGSRGR